MFYLLTLCVSVTVVICEPSCSSFHYHEQLLERVIDMKCKMDIFSSKIDKWEKVLLEKLTTFDGIKSALETQVMEVQEELEKNRAIKDDTKTPDVYFKARSVKEQSPTKGETVVFQTVVQNEGLGYSNDTGLFTAPVSGTYLFTTQFCLHDNKAISITIVVNRTDITAATFGDKDWNSICASTDGIARVEEGDSVKVQVTYTYSGAVIYSDTDSTYWSYFSGVLLHK